MVTRYKGTKREMLALDTFVKLLRAGETISGDVHRALKAENLTVSQFGVLEALYHIGPMCQRDLAEKILKSTGNITTVIDNLEKRQLVVRNRDMKDRRFFRIALTEKGEKRIRAIFPDHAERIEKRMATLTSAEKKTLGRLCKKLSGIQ